MNLFSFVQANCFLKQVTFGWLNCISQAHVINSKPAVNRISNINPGNQILKILFKKD